MSDSTTETTVPQGSERGFRVSAMLALRGAIPARLDLAVARKRGQRAWERNASAREHALASMEAIVGGTERGGEREELARLQLIEAHLRDVFFWRPWRAPDLDAESRAHLAAALAGERPRLLSACHLGPFFLSMGAVARVGPTPYAIAGPWLFGRDTGAWGRRIERWRRGVAGQGQLLIRTGGAFEQVAALLSRGEVVQIYFDMPGRQPASFLGKRVMLAGGTARLAKHTDALVLPLHTRRTGTRLATSIGEPLDSRDYAEPQELHQALALIHERAILSSPEQLEDPNREGAWEGGASAGGWERPSDPHAKPHG